MGTFDLVAFSCQNIRKEHFLSRILQGVAESAASRSDDERSPSPQPVGGRAWTEVWQVEYPVSEIWSRQRDILWPAGRKWTCELVNMRDYSYHRMHSPMSWAEWVAKMWDMTWCCQDGRCEAGAGHMPIANGPEDWEIHHTSRCQTGPIVFDHHWYSYLNLLCNNLHVGDQIAPSMALGETSAQSGSKTGAIPQPRDCPLAFPSKLKFSVLECCSHQVVSRCETVQLEGFLWNWSRYAAHNFPRKNDQNHRNQTVFQRLEQSHAAVKQFPDVERRERPACVARISVPFMIRYLTSSTAHLCVHNNSVLNLCANDKFNSVLQNLRPWHEAGSIPGQPLFRRSIGWFWTQPDLDPTLRDLCDFTLWWALDYK